MNEAAAVKSICILRLSALGDATHVLPLIRRLQKYRPDCQITWILGKGEAKLMQGLEGVELIAFDKNAGLKGVQELARQLAGRRFDALLQMQLALRANLISSVISARRRIGYDRQRAKEGHSLFINERIKHDKHHVLDVFNLFGDALDLPSTAIEWRIPLEQQDRDWALAQWPSDKPCLLISACSSHSLRNWLPERYAAVASHAQTRGWQVVLCGGRSALERQIGDAITAAMPEKPIDLIGKDTLKQLLAMLERATLVVSPDSGPAHMANALATPVLGLYACTDAERSGPYHSRHYCVNRYPDAALQFLQKQTVSLPWGKRVEFEGVMALIETGEVIARFEQFCQDQRLA